METDNQELLLVIDDDAHVRASICMYMEDQGFEVIEASDGEEGLNLFFDRKPDLVFCDLRMPGLDGLEVLHRVNTEAPGTPVIVISGAGRIQDVVEALRRGAWNFVSKPVEDMAVLRHVAVQAIEKARLQRENERYHAYLEAEVVQRTRQLAKSTARAKMLAEEANAANRAKGEFLSNMSHELRTPLNSIMVLSRVLAENREGNLNRKQTEMLEQISSSGHELLGLVNEVLDVAELESTLVQLDMRLISVAGFVGRIERIISPLAWQKGLDYEIEVADDAPDTFFSDELKVSRIVRNIITNAVKFTSEGKINIYVGRSSLSDEIEAAGIDEKPSLIVKVTDTGIGIEPELQEKIFSIFMQADGSDNRRFQGSGLGLAIASRFAAALGGDILLDSIPGKGSAFTLVLPAEREMDSDEVRTISRNPVQNHAERFSALPMDAIRFNGEKILIADDDMRVVFNLSAMLESLGAEALISGSEESLLQRLEEAVKDESRALSLVICSHNKLTRDICTSLEAMQEKAPRLIVLSKGQAIESPDNDADSGCPLGFHTVESPPTYKKIVPLIQKLLW